MDAASVNSAHRPTPRTVCEADGKNGVSSEPEKKWENSVKLNYSPTPFSKGVANRRIHGIAMPPSTFILNARCFRLFSPLASSPFTSLIIPHEFIRSDICLFVRARPSLVRPLCSRGCGARPYDGHFNIYHQSIPINFARRNRHSS